MATFTVKDYETIVQDIVDYLITNSSEITDMNVGSVIRSLIEAYSLELNGISIDKDGLYQQIQNVYNARSISTATGADLDELAALVGVTRKSGIKSQVQLTLKRNTPIPVDTVISTGSVFSTQPTSTSSGLRFNSIQDYTFTTGIINESHPFKNGIYNYKLDERFYDTVSSVDGVVSSVPTTFTLTNYTLTKNYNGEMVDVSTITEIDTCEVTTGWTGSTDAFAVTLNSGTKLQGSNSLNIGKTGTTQSYFNYTKTYATSSNLTNKQVHFKLKILDTTTLNKLTSMKVQIGNDIYNYLEFTFTPSTDLVVGWNDIYLNTSDAVTTGIPIVTNITYFKLHFDVTNAATTITSGNMNLDYIIFAEVENYVGDIIQWNQAVTLPDTGSNFTVDYVPLSKEVIVQADSIGSSYNVAIGKLNYKITNLPDITSVYNYEPGLYGENEEDDESLRIRIPDAAYANGKATVSSIKTGLESLDYVLSANVVDLPLKTETGETFTYVTGTNNYKLDFDVAQDDSTLQVLGYATTLNGGINNSVTSIVVTSAAGLKASGYIKVDSEIIQYASITTNTLNSCTRGVLGTVAASHLTLATVNQYFVRNTDFELNGSNEIVFGIGGNNPNNGNSIIVDYTYKWLGHVEISVIGPTNFTATQMTEIEDKIIEYIAAGIQYTWATPTSTYVNVTADINIKAGYNATVVKTSVIEALQSRLNSFNIGENVYLSQLIDTIMSVEGVNYTDVSTPAANITVAVDETVKPGTILITVV